MTVKDGFKFGIGYTLGRGMFNVLADLCDRKSRIRRQFKRCVAAFKAAERPAKPANYASVTINDHLDTADM